MKKMSENLILIVDDASINLDILVESLGNMYDVTTAKDGKSALESIAKNPPDLILLDIEMPGMNGYEVCWQLKEDEATKDIPVIMLTSLSDYDSQIKGLKFGAVDYLVKPAREAILHAKVKNFLELKNGKDELQRLSKEREYMIQELSKAFVCETTLKEKLPVCASIVDSDKKNSSFKTA